MNLFGSSVTSSSSCLSLSFLWTCSHLWKFATWMFICRGTYCTKEEKKLQPKTLLTVQRERERTVPQLLTFSLNLPGAYIGQMEATSSQRPRNQRSAFPEIAGRNRKETGNGSDHKQESYLCIWAPEGKLSHPKCCLLLAQACSQTSSEFHRQQALATQVLTKCPALLQVRLDNFWQMQI